MFGFGKLVKSRQRYNARHLSQLATLKIADLVKHLDALKYRPIVPKSETNLHFGKKGAGSLWS